MSNTEFFERLVNVGRCTKVTKGGRKFSFSAIVIIGNKMGLVGYGIGKSSEIIEAKHKAVNAAKKIIYKIPVREGRTIHHKIVGKFLSSKIIMRPALPGNGIVSGGATRPLFDILGIKDIVAKALGSRNSINVIRATLSGLLKIETPCYIIKKRKYDTKYF